MPMLDVDGVSLFYRVKGEGTPIVFIHPPVLTSVNFTYQLEELSKKYKVILFDMRGHGNSGHSNAPITYPLIVEDIHKLMDRLNIKEAFICGYSTGGSIVLEFLLTYPKRALGGIVISGLSEVKDQHLFNKITFAKNLANTGAVSFLALSTAWSNSGTKKLFFRMLSNNLKSNAENVEQYYDYSLKYNCTNQLEQIQHPMLLVYGKKDKGFHGYAKLLSKKLPNNEIKFIKDTKHQIPTKAPKELNQFIERFIDTQNAKH